jgi:transposase
LLADLCKGIAEAPRKPRRGRPKLPLADAVFAVCFKVYSTVSARRFMGDLEEAHRQEYVSTLPHYNSIFNYLEDEALTPILCDLIRQSSLPLREVETEFAVDSSGFCTSRFTRWFDVKYGVTREEADWVKVHLMCGIKTNVVTAVEILDKHAGDSPQFPKLVKATAAGFKVAEVSADKAYTATENLQAVADLGGTLYAPFKKNATGAVGGIFEKAFHYFCLNREEFLAHYHKRSNVESTFSMVKRKFGDAVRSKTDVAMRNEVLAKIVCHNLCCVIGAWYDLGIEPIFGAGDSCPKNPEPAQILRFHG